MGAHVTAAGIGVMLTTLYQLACATDPTQLQDFCVATNDIQNALFVNEKICKNPMEVEAEDFFFKGLNVAGNTDNQLGSDVTRVDVKAFPALNTMGISLARVDLALNGVNPPHIHPRATEVTTLLEGCAYVGFVSSNNDGNRLFTKILYPGDVFVFPQGMVHFEFNVGMTPAVLLVAFSSQEPGVSTIANATFRSNPPISPDVLSKAFQVDKSVINYLQSIFGM